VEYLLSFILLSFSALFSGLTLGYFSLNLNTLERRAKHGNKEAIAVYPIRKHGNLLLTTLLLGNVAVNTALSVYLGSLVSGAVAGVTATAMIFLFGEIIPQAAFSRHALWFGSRLAPLVKVLIFVMLPITFPISYMLDKLLGKEMPTLYSKLELKQIVSDLEESEYSDVDADEERIIHGALQFSHTNVRDIMTPKERVVLYEKNQRLSQEFIETISDTGFSRYPVYSGNQDNIVGILYSRDLISEEEDASIGETEEAYNENFLKVRPDEKLDVVLGRMLKQKKHMGIVLTKNNQFQGVVTLEDIIEEIIQSEIEDEGDANAYEEEAEKNVS
jgi:metal transporter CNNM